MALVDYSSSESDQENETTKQKSLTQGLGTELKDDASLTLSFVEAACKRGSSSPPAKRSRLENDEAATNAPLSLPSAILDMFTEESSDERGSTDHQGRVRSFAHVRGNWATHVYVPVTFTTSVISCINRLKYCLQTHYSCEFHSIPPTDYHVSVSRTVPILHHWIDPLMGSLRENLQSRDSFVMGFREIEFYVNDEGTRSFVGLTVDSGHEERNIGLGTRLIEYIQQMCALVKAVDLSFAAYKLPEYYKDPSFHVSLFWCLGDITKDTESTIETMLQDHWTELIEKESLTTTEQILQLQIEEVRCKTGNKVYTFPLCT